MCSGRVSVVSAHWGAEAGGLWIRSHLELHRVLKISLNNTSYIFVRYWILYAFSSHAMCMSVYTVCVCLSVCPYRLPCLTWKLCCLFIVCARIADQWVSQNFSVFSPTPRRTIVVKYDWGTHLVFILMGSGDFSLGSSHLWDKPLSLDHLLGPDPEVSCPLKSVSVSFLCCFYVCFLHISLL